MIEAKPDTTIYDTLLGADIEIEHTCRKLYACTTCHMIMREDFNSLDEAIEEEGSLLDKAQSPGPNSRLSCQARVAKSDLTVEIPKYTIDHAKGNR